MKVREAMHEGVTWVTPEEPIIEIARLMREDDVGSIPVGENDRLVGMVTDRDIVLRGFADGDDPLQLKARDVMSEQIIFCMAEEDVEDAVRLMEKNQIRRLPVIDRNKRMVGMLSLGDVAASSTAPVSHETLKAVSDHHS